MVIPLSQIRRGRTPKTKIERQIRTLPKPAKRLNDQLLRKFLDFIQTPDISTMPQKEVQEIELWLVSPLSSKYQTEDHKPLSWDAINLLVREIEGGARALLRGEPWRIPSNSLGSLS